MDLNAIRQKLGALQSRGGAKNKLAENIWKASIGKHQVRVVPSKYNKEMPFRELFFHYGFGNRTMLALTNFGEKDPIVEFAEGLKAQKPYVEENWKFAVKMLPKIQIFLPVIVRGEEQNGVKLWQFGKEVYMELCKLAEDEEVGDYTDISEGRDLIVETVGPDQSGRAFNKTSVRPKMKSTPLSEDPKEIEQWLNNQPNPDEIFTKPTYDELKKALHDFLTPPDETGSEDKQQEVDDDTTVPAQGAAKDELPWGKSADEGEDKYSLEGVGTKKPSKKAKDIDEQITKLFKQK